MIRHVTMFKFKESFDERDRATWVEGLDRLRDVVPELLSLAHGANAFPSDSASFAAHYDYAVVADFDDAQGVAAYGANEDHVRIAQISIPNSDHLVTVDFEVPDEQPSTLPLCQPASPTQSHHAGEVMAITGGAAGIGREVALQWVLSGGDVVLLDKDEEALANATELLGTRARGIVVDVADRASIDDAFTTIGEISGKLNALVNCAGIARHAKLQDIDDADWALTLDVHLGGAMRSSRAAQRLLHAAASLGEQASIVNVSSIAAFSGTPARAAYSTAKAGIDGLTRTLAVELAAVGIRVNSVAPGYTRTALVEELIRTKDVVVESATRRIPMHRMAEPADIASPIVFLCSTGASFITGSTLLVDGGMTIDGDWQG
jgi:NAD(P)-dependent dehydrogenase (short-subunit alcohol dehydrogenase family)